MILTKWAGLLTLLSRIVGKEIQNKMTLLLQAKRAAALFSLILRQHARQPMVRTLCLPIFIVEAKRKCCKLASDVKITHRETPKRVCLA